MYKIKWKIINIPGGVASLDNTTISTVGVDNLNIYNKTIHSKTKLNILLKEISNQLLKLLSNQNYKKMFNLLFNEKSKFKVVVLASPGL